MTASEQAAKLVTPAIREAVKEHNRVCKSLRKMLGREWMSTLPDDLGPYMLKMHQLTLMVWIANHPRDKEDYEKRVVVQMMQDEKAKGTYDSLTPPILPISSPEGVKGVVIGSPEFMQQLVEYKRRKRV